MEQYMNTGITRGEIYWIENKDSYGEDAVCVKKTRPAVIISNDTGNRYGAHVVVVYLTTAAKRDLPTHCTIRSAYAPSTALCEQPTTVNKLRIGDYIGKCTDTEMASIDLCLSIALGLNAPDRAQEYDEPEEDLELEENIDTIKIEMPEEKPEPESGETNNSEIEELRIELIKAKHGEEIMRQLYQELLDKTISTRHAGDRHPIIRV